MGFKITQTFFAKPAVDYCVVDKFIDFKKNWI
jgi:hypothetical protein